MNEDIVKAIESIIPDYASRHNELLLIVGQAGNSACQIIELLAQFGFAINDYIVSALATAINVVITIDNCQKAIANCAYLNTICRK